MPSYYDYINRLYDLIEVNPLSSNAQLLYHTLLMIFNRAHWEEELRRTNDSISRMCGLGIRALTNARNELKQAGLIDFKSDKRRGHCTKYYLCNDFCSCKNTHQTQYKRNTKESQSYFKEHTYKDKRYNTEDRRYFLKNTCEEEKPLAGEYDNLEIYTQNNFS